MGVREARSGFRFQLVRGEVLGLERQGLGEVAFYLGGALAGDPVDEVERDVVKSGIAKKIDGAPDVVRSGNTLEHLEQGRAGSSGRRARRGSRGCAAGADASSGVTVSGFASTVTSTASGSPASRRSSAAGSVKVGVPPPRKIVSTSGASSSALERELGEQRVDVAGVVAAPADRGHEVAVAAAMGTERQVDVEVRRHQSTRSCTTTACDQSRLAKRSWSRSSTGG